MQASTRRKTIHFVALELSMWGAFSVWGFMVVFLRDRGLDTTTIGTIYATNAVIVVAAQPLWGIISDRRNSTREVFVFCFAASMILFCVLPFVRGVVPLFVLMNASAFVRAPIVTMLDTWIVEETRIDPNLDYGRIRLFGAFTFAPLALLYGTLIDRYSVNVIFVGFALMGTITILVALLTQETAQPTRHTGGRIRPRILLRNLPLVAFAILGFCLFAPGHSYFVFAPMIVGSFGGTTSDLGLLLFVLSLSEVPAFFLAKRFIQRSNYRLILIASALIHVLFFFLYSRVASIPGLILIQMIKGTGFALFMSASVYYVRSLVPRGIKATAQTVTRSVYEGGGAVVSSSLGGMVIERGGVGRLTSIALITSVIGTLVFLLSIVARTALRRRRVSAKPPE